MDKSQAITQIENTEIELERVRDILQITLETIERDMPKEPYSSKNSDTLTYYICYGNRASILISLLDTVFANINNMCNSLTDFIEEAYKLPTDDKKRKESQK